MTIETNKTGQHLRRQVLNQGLHERMRAMQALNHGYSGGSEAVLATLLLASLGGETAHESNVDQSMNFDQQTDNLRSVSIGQVANPMLACANDDDYSVNEAASAR